MRTSLEEGIKLHRFAGMFPEQFLTEAGRHRKAMVAADQRMVIRCLGDDLPGFVHDVSHVPPPIQRALSRPSCCRQNGNQDIGEVADQSDTSASAILAMSMMEARLGSSAMRHPWWQSSDGIDLRQRYARTLRKPRRRPVERLNQFPRGEWLG